MYNSPATTGHYRKRYTMSWEKRNGTGTYYTRSRRVNGRVVREYIGAGSVGEIAHKQDLIRRSESSVERESMLLQKVEHAALLSDIDSFIDLAECIASGFLVLSGFHQHHRGEWRRRNVNNRK